MKKVLVLGALCALVTGASAQVKAYKADQMTNPNSVAYALPRTVVKVRVVAEKESVRVGPYARFAQKYLGVIAPLADKDIYTIKSATLCGVRTKVRCGFTIRLPKDSLRPRWTAWNRPASPARYVRESGCGAPARM